MIGKDFFLQKICQNLQQQNVDQKDILLNRW